MDWHWYWQLKQCVHHPSLIVMYCDRVKLMILTKRKSFAKTDNFASFPWFLYIPKFNKLKITLIYVGNHSSPELFSWTARRECRQIGWFSNLVQLEPPVIKFFSNFHAKGCQTKRCWVAVQNLIAAGTTQYSSCYWREHVNIHKQVGCGAFAMERKRVLWFTFREKPGRPKPGSSQSNNQIQAVSRYQHQNQKALRISKPEPDSFQDIKTKTR